MSRPGGIERVCVLAQKADSQIHIFVSFERIVAAIQATGSMGLAGVVDQLYAFILQTPTYTYQSPLPSPGSQLSCCIANVRLQ